MLLTWVGPALSPLKKARTSTDKAFVKDSLDNRYDCEKLADEIIDVELSRVGYTKSC